MGTNYYSACTAVLVVAAVAAVPAAVAVVVLMTMQIPCELLVPFSVRELLRYVAYINGC